jgi:hypothetical protein
MSDSVHIDANKRDAKEKAARRSCFPVSANHIDKEGLPIMRKTPELESVSVGGELSK